MKITNPKTKNIKIKIKETGREHDVALADMLLKSEGTQFYNASS